MRAGDRVEVKGAGEGTIEDIDDWEGCLFITMDKGQDIIASPDRVKLLTQMTIYEPDYEYMTYGIGWPD